MKTMHTVPGVKSPSVMQMKRLREVVALAVALGLVGCSRQPTPGPSAKKTIVATYSVLGAVVKDLVGDQFDVKVVIPNGSDLHAWEPSAKEIEALTKADLIVQNGLDLEGGMQRAIGQARQVGAKLFTAADHVTVRKVGSGEGADSDEHHHDHPEGAGDPHIWTDPVAMKLVARALVTQIRADFGLDLSVRLSDLEKRLDALDSEITTTVAAIPPENRRLVTGHRSLGYFAQRYGFRVVGAVVPSLSTEAESSAAEVANLKRLIRENGVKVLFTEVGTPPRVVETLAKEVGVKAVPLATHSIPADGSYLTFMHDLATAITGNLE